MKKLLLLFFGLAALAYGQCSSGVIGSEDGRVHCYAISSLGITDLSTIAGASVYSNIPPAALHSGQYWIVPDCSTSTACSAGGGTGYVGLIYSNGSSWAYQVCLSCGTGGSGAAASGAAGYIQVAGSGGAFVGLQYVPVANGGTGAGTASPNYFFAGPASGGAGAGSFRQLVTADLTGALSTGLSDHATLAYQQSVSNSYFIDSGTSANQYIVTTLDSGYTGGRAGAWFFVKLNNGGGNCTASTFITINGGTSRTMHIGNGRGTTSGDCPNGATFLAYDDGTNIDLLPINTGHQMSTSDLTVVDAATPTKKMLFSLANNTAATTRTFYKLDANGTDIGGAATVTLSATPAFGVDTTTQVLTLASGTTITSSTMPSGRVVGQLVHVQIVEPAGGGQVFVQPTNWANVPAIRTGSGVKNDYLLVWDGTNWNDAVTDIFGNASGLGGTPGCSTSGQGYVNSSGVWTCATLATAIPATNSTAGIVIPGTGMDVTAGGVLSTNTTTAGDLGMKCDGSTSDSAAINTAANMTVLLPQNGVCMVSNLNIGNHVILRGNATLKKIASDTANPLFSQYNGTDITFDGITFDLNSVIWGSYPNNNTNITALTCTGGVGYPPYTTVAMSFSGGGGSNLGGLMYTSGTGTCDHVQLTVPGHGYTSNPTASASCPVGWSGCTVPTFAWGTTTPATAANTLTSSNSAQLTFQYVDQLHFRDVKVTNTGGTMSNGSLYANAFSFVGSSGDAQNTVIDATVGGLHVYYDPYQNGSTRTFRWIGGSLDGSQLGGIKIQSSSLLPKVKVEVAGVAVGCRAGAWTYTTTFSGALSSGATSATVASIGPLQVGNPIIFPSHASDTTETVGFRITAISGSTITWTPALTSAHTSGQSVVYPFQVYGTYDATGNNGPYGNGIDTFLVGGVNMHDNRICEPRFSGVRIAGVGSVNNIADHNTIDYAGETGLYCAELGAMASNCRGNVLTGTNISDANPTSRPGTPLDLPNLIAENFLSDCGYACIHMEHATATGNHMWDAAIGIDLGNGGTGYNNVATDNIVVNTGLGAVTGGVGIAVSQGLTTTSTLGNYLRGNQEIGTTFPSLAVASINSFGPNITGITNANPAVVTFGSAPNPVINVGEVWMFRGQYMVQVTPNAAGKYPSINGNFCGVTATTTSAPYTATCGGVTGVPALNTTTYTPWQAPLAGNNPGPFTRVFTTSLAPATWPNKVKLVRDNSTGIDQPPTITPGAALGTGSPTATANASSSDGFTQFTTVLGTSPTTGTVATGVFSIPSSRFSSNMCSLPNAASTLSITTTQTGWTITTSATATAGTITVSCKLD